MYPTVHYTEIFTMNLGLITLTIINYFIIGDVIATPPLEFEEKDHYEFWLDIQISMTMAVHYRQINKNHFVIYDKGSKEFKIRDPDDRTPCNKTLNEKLTDRDLSRLIVADGLHKPVVSLNDSLGPNFVVREGAKVTFHIRNRMYTEPFTIHFHGLPQKGGYFWNDGVGMVSQFPIMPGQTFEQTFIAKPAGTFWYHEHYGTHRADGLYGALVVLPKEKDPIPIENQYVMVISDWFTGQSRDEWLKFY